MHHLNALDRQGLIVIEIREICKSYKSDSFVQNALDIVSIVFRECEFVAVLGPSGSGKTTLLNVLGGLDHADSGDIIIDGVSTRNYKSSDWDTYRNHRIGFIFQSYNLIPHQSILNNVALAPTLSGASREECRTRATEALVKVGLADHINKKPSQLSGGQMQRVAIARALVCDPDIVLADEPTGALDTETGLQVMDLLAEIARDRLVIMVTHNPNLAERYATRTVKLSDGHIMDDDNPVVPDGAPFSGAPDGTSDAGETDAIPVAAQSAGMTANGEADRAPATLPIEISDGMGPDEASTPTEPLTRMTTPALDKGRKASMSFRTALGLSFSNLMTKKARTILTAFAGSIGIFGIAAILALSNGVNDHIDKVEEDTLSSYPVSITKTSYDLSSLMGVSSDDEDETTVTPTPQPDANPDLIPEVPMISDMFASIENNDLASFKTYLESGQSDVYDHVNTIRYDYGVVPQIFKSDTSDGVVQLNPGPMESLASNSINSSTAFASSGMTSNSYQEMIEDRELLDEQFDVVRGRWPDAADECVLVLTRSGKLSDYTLYSIGILDPNEFKELAEKAMDSQDVEIPDTKVDFTFDDAMNLTFKVVPQADCYRYTSDTDTWTKATEDDDFMKERVENGLTLKVVGIIQPSATTRSPSLTEGIAYTHALTTTLIDRAAQSDIVKSQLENPDVDVFTGKTFDELKDENRGAFDMSSLFSVDEAALESAFSFDTSGLDLSGFDADMGDLDLSGMDTSQLANTMRNVPPPDFSSLGNAELSASDQKAVSDLAQDIARGFMPYWYEQHPGEAITENTDFSKDFQSYLATEKVADQMAKMQVIAGAALQQQVTQVMQDYMVNTYQPYIEQAMAQMIQQMAQQMAAAMSSGVQQQMQQLFSQMGSLFSVDAEAFAGALHFNMTQDDLTNLLQNYLNAEQLSYDHNLTKLGYAEESSPQSINLYPIDFSHKEQVLKIIDGYNEQMKAQGKDDQVISYSDIMGALISSVTDIVDMISAVLIAFVSISLLVSSIMIGIITYISVLERKKEIGILRAMGASKGNIANVFNAETAIEGLAAGLLAIGTVYLLSIPVNIIIRNSHHVRHILHLPVTSAIVLILISMALTLIAGIIPSRKAANRDPVEALRGE